MLLYKTLAVFIKVFSRPLINITKKLHFHHHNAQSRSKLFFLYLGNKFHIMESHLNRRFLNLSDSMDFKIKKLNDELALEKGIDYFYEMIFYGILICVPIMEMIKAYNEQEKKNIEVNEKIENIENNIKNLKDKLIVEEKRISNEILQIKDVIHVFCDKIDDIQIKNNSKIDNLNTDILKTNAETHKLIKQMFYERQELSKQIFLNQNLITQKLSQNI